jgi:hypothetical protein
MGDLLESLIWGAKSGQYCVIGGGSLQNGIRAIAQPEMVGACTSPMRDANGDAGSKEGVIVTSHIAWE